MEQQKQAIQKKQGSILRGLIGAVLGAVLGGALWCAIAIGTETIYSVIGLLVGLVVGFGYDLFKGRKGLARMVIVLVCVLIAAIGGTVVAHAYWLHDWYAEEAEFIATASKEELLRNYYTEEDIAAYDSYPTLLQERMLELVDVTMPSEEEYYEMFLTDSDYIGEVIGNCVTSALFAVLGSFALILNNGKVKKQRASDEQTINFDEAALDLPEGDEASADTNEEAQA